MSIGMTTIMPDTAYAMDISKAQKDPEILVTWTDEKAKDANDEYLKTNVHQGDETVKSVATGLAFNQNFYTGWRIGNPPQSLMGWPLGGMMYLEPVSGYDNSEYKAFEFAHLFCTANHETAASIILGSRAFCSGIYKLENNPFPAATQNGQLNPSFNFLMLAIATAYANNGDKIQANATTVNQDPMIGEAIVGQSIAWECTNTPNDGIATEGFTGEWAHDFNYFKTYAGGYYYHGMTTAFADSDPQIHAWMNAAADANGEAVKSGLGITNRVEEAFYNIWTTAMLTGQLKNDYDKNITYAGTAINDGVALDGMYHATMTLEITSTTSQQLANMKFTPYGDWQLKSVKPAANVIVWDFISSTAEVDENGCIGSFSGAGDLGVAVPTDMTKAKLYTFDTWNMSVNQGGKKGAFGRTQTQFASITEGDSQML